VQNCARSKAKKKKGGKGGANAKDKNAVKKKKPERPLGHEGRKTLDSRQVTAAGIKLQRCERNNIAGGKNKTTKKILTITRKSRSAGSGGGNT